MTEPRFYASPVDYEAWRKGYMPPSEHVLIDALAHRGAKVISMAAVGDTAWWLVIQGKRPSRKQLQAVQRALLDMMDDELEVLPSSEAQNSSPSEASAGNSGLDERSQAAILAGRTLTDIDGGGVI